MGELLLVEIEVVLSVGCGGCDATDDRGLLARELDELLVDVLGVDRGVGEGRYLSLADCEVIESGVPLVRVKRVLKIPVNQRDLDLKLFLGILFGSIKHF